MASEKRAATAAYPGVADDVDAIAPGTQVAAKAANGETYPMMRQLGGRAYQLLAATRAADHFIAREGEEDRDTGSWLIACALGLADKLANELEELANEMRRTSGDVALPGSERRAGPALRSASI